MKIINKILFFLFFLFISFANIGNDVEACQQISTSNFKATKHYTLENDMVESFIAIPNNANTISFNADFDDVETQNFSQRFYFKDNKFINSQYHTISFLYETEVFPNAP